MSEILREIEEELKRERWLALWQRWQREVIGGVVGLVLLVMGLVLWWYMSAWQTEEASSDFDMALALKDKSAEQAFHDLAKRGGSYGALAAFHEAAALAKRKRWRQAVALYDDLAGQAVLPFALRDLARINAAALLSGRVPLAEIEDRLRRAASDQGVLRYSAREIIAIAAMQANDHKRARALLAPMVADPLVPASLVARAQIMLDSLPPPPNPPKPIDRR